MWNFEQVYYWFGMVGGQSVQGWYNYNPFTKQWTPSNVPGVGQKLSGIITSQGEYVPGATSGYEEATERLKRTGTDYPPGATPLMSEQEMYRDALNQLGDIDDAAAQRALNRIRDLQGQLSQRELQFTLGKSRYSQAIENLDRREIALKGKAQQLENEAKKFQREFDSYSADLQAFNRMVQRNEFPRDATVLYNELEARRQSLESRQAALLKQEEGFKSSVSKYNVSVDKANLMRAGLVQTGSEMEQIGWRIKPPLVRLKAYELEPKQRQEFTVPSVEPYKKPKLEETIPKARETFWRTRTAIGIPVAGEVIGGIATAGELVAQPARVAAYTIIPETSRVTIGLPKFNLKEPRLGEIDLKKSKPFISYTPTTLGKKEQVEVWGELGRIGGEFLVTGTIAKGVGRVAKEIAKVSKYKVTSVEVPGVKGFKLTYKGTELPEIKGVSIERVEPVFKYKPVQKLYELSKKISPPKLRGTSVKGIVSAQEPVSYKVPKLPIGELDDFISIKTPKGFELISPEPLDFQKNISSFIGRAKTFPTNGVTPSGKVESFLIQSKSYPVSFEQPIGRIYSEPTMEILKAKFPFEEKQIKFLAGGKEFAVYPQISTDLTAKVWDVQKGKWVLTRTKGYGFTQATGLIESPVGGKPITPIEFDIKTPTWVKGIVSKKEIPFSVKQASTGTQASGMKSLQKLYEKTALDKIAKEFSAATEQKLVKSLASGTQKVIASEKALEKIVSAPSKAVFAPSITKQRLIDLTLPSEPQFQIGLPKEFQAPSGISFAFPITKELTQPKIKPAELSFALPAIKLGEPVKPKATGIPATSLASLSGIKSLEKQLQKQSQRQAQMAEQFPISITTPTIKARQAITPRVKVPQITIQKFKTPPPIEPFNWDFIPPPPPPPILLPKKDFPIFTEKKKKTRKGFIVFGKRFGKFFKLTPKPLTKETALALGAKWADITAGRTFKLMPSLEPAAGEKKLFNWFNFSKMFKAKPNLTFVERTAYAISTPGEKREITFKGLQALKFKPLLGGESKMAKRKRGRKKKR